VASDQQAYEFDPTGRLVADTPEVLRNAAEGGVGVAKLKPPSRWMRPISLAVKAIGGIES
jgi:hypothetical protein